jgi:hypothetical protein
MIPLFLKMEQGNFYFFFISFPLFFVRVLWAVCILFPVRERSNMTLAAILAGTPVSNLRKEYQFHQNLYEAQPALVQNFLDQQAQAIAQAIIADAPRVRFTLPNRVAVTGEADVLDVPANQREQVAGHWLLFGTRDLCLDILQLFLGLERSSNPALSLSGSLLRFSVARTMVYQLLPDGRPVRYRLLEGDEIPSQPEKWTGVPSAHEDDRDRLQVPFTPAALRFFLPQWVAFGEKDQLLTNTLEEAQSRIASMQNFLSILHHAVTIDPYFVADEAYQRKRTGMLGQLVNQGRALARYETHELVTAVQRRAQANSLNRGFSLDLSYFDDQELTMRSYNVEVVPPGRVMFIPAFVVLAMRREYGRIIQDTHLNSSTRKNLLALLAMLEKAFLTKKEYSLL